MSSINIGSNWGGGIILKTWGPIIDWLTRLDISATYYLGVLSTADLLALLDLDWVVFENKHNSLQAAGASQENLQKFLMLVCYCVVNRLRLLRGCDLEFSLHFTSCECLKRGILASSAVARRFVGY